MSYEPSIGDVMIVACPMGRSPKEPVIDYVVVDRVLKRKIVGHVQDDPKTKLEYSRRTLIELCNGKPNSLGAKIIGVAA